MSRMRINFVDSLRGFLILCVVVGHTLNTFLNLNMFPEHRTGMFVVFNIIYAFHMPAFIIVSGYVFQFSYCEEDSARNRGNIYMNAANMFATSATWGLITAIVKLLLVRFTTIHVSYPPLVADMFLVLCKPVGECWYLYVLCLLYLIFSRVGVTDQNKWVLFLLLSCVCIFSQYTNILLFEVSLVLYYAVFFFLGIIARKSPGWVTDNKWVLAASLMVSVLLFIRVWDKSQTKTGLINTIPVVSPVIALGLSLTIWYLFTHISCLGSSLLLRYLGRHSLEVYLIHIYFTAGMRVVLRFFDIQSFILSLAATIFTAIVVPLLCSEVLRKLRIYNLFFKPVTFALDLRSKTRG